jgi:hypothetical protein
VNDPVRQKVDHLLGDRHSNTDLRFLGGGTQMGRTDHLVEVQQGVGGRRRFVDEDV